MAVATPFLTDDDVRLLAEGGHYRAYDKLGAHVIEQEGASGTHFAVWAPGARQISVIGDFNGWTADANPMTTRGSSGLWTCMIPGVRTGALYRYGILSRHAEGRLERIDPYGFAAEMGAATASRVWELSRHVWGDQGWMAGRDRLHALEAPISIYEVHLGSWMRIPEEGNRWLTYQELAPRLAEYVQRMGYTHVELLPVAEHPLDGSLGYHPLAYFAPTSRFGTPDDFMLLVDTLHRQGLGVILDWVPAHFPPHEQGLASFDGTALYEQANVKQPEHEWESPGFNYGRPEVRNFLISNALFWLDKYHIDGLRVGSVAALLYRDGAGRDPQTIEPSPNGQENPEGIAFVRRLNQVLLAEYPDVLTIAEEATAWRRVSRPTYLEGLGFRLKWDTGWMHDTLQYMAFEPIYRTHHHNQLTFRMLYAYSENYVLPLSHELVVHGQRSLLARMPGDEWQKMANLRLLLGYMYGQAGKKLLFMGGELGQWQAWNPDTSLDWHLQAVPRHQGLQRWVRDLNTLYRAEPALHQLDCDPAGFEWVDCHDAAQSVLSFLRKGKAADAVVLVVCNFTPTPRQNYRVGVSQPGHWEEILNSDAPLYAGSGQGNLGGARAAPVPWHGRSYLLNLTLPPLGMVVFKRKA